MWRFKLVIMKITIALKDEEDRSTTSGSFCGTVSYVSPEVLKDKPATVATDLWAAGCIMYEVNSHQSISLQSLLTMRTDAYW